MKTDKPLTELIAPNFYDQFWKVWDELFTHYWEKGGRGSTKSSFISLMIPLKMMDDAEKGIHSNALVIRRVKDTLAESVLEQLEWAVNMLGVAEEWKVTTKPMRMIYKPTGQVIRFRGADNTTKLKSTKVKKGWFKYIWYEEVDEFENYSKITSINQSLMRGGTNYLVFYSFNPPKSQRNWVNKEILDERPDKSIHSTDYRKVPSSWLSEQFIIEAEHMKKVKPKQYEHEYLGHVVGTGAEVFTNVHIRPISDEEIASFSRVKRGIDFGYSADPFAYNAMHFDKTRRKIYIFHEIYKTRLSNSNAVRLIKKENIYNRPITADNEDPRTINEFRILGLNINAAKKGPYSVERGIKYLSEEIEEIIIDPYRCPNTKREFIDYEIETDKDGNLKGEYPDKNNHTIDAVRYAMEDETNSRRIKTKKKPRGL